MSERRCIYFGRGFGHTQAMLNGAKNADNVVIVAHTQQFADYLAKQCKNARGVGLDRTERLLGSHLPIVVDHYAFEILLGERERRIAQLEAENEALMGVLDRLADWLERVNDDPLGALTDGFPSPENVVIYLRQKSWEIKNKDALAGKETPCP